MHVVECLVVHLVLRQEIDHQRRFAAAGAADERHEERGVRQGVCDAVVDADVAHELGGAHVEPAGVFGKLCLYHDYTLALAHYSTRRNTFRQDGGAIAPPQNRTLL